MVRVLARSVVVGDRVMRWDGRESVPVTVTAVNPLTESGHLVLETTGGSMVFGSHGRVRPAEEES